MVCLSCGHVLYQQKQLAVTIQPWMQPKELEAEVKGDILD